MPDPLVQGTPQSSGWVPNTPFVPASERPQVSPTPSDALKAGNQPMVPSGTSAYPDPLQSALKTRVESASVSPLRTYQSDLAFAMKSQNTSAVQMVAREQDRGSQGMVTTMPKNPNQSGLVQQQSSLPKIVFAIAIILFVGGVGFLGYAAYVRFAPSLPSLASLVPSFSEKPAPQKPNTPAPVVTRTISRPLVSAEVARDVSVMQTSPAALTVTLAPFRSESGFTRLDLFRATTSVPLVTADFLPGFGRNALPELLRSFEPRFAFGYFAHQNESDAYLILTTRSYSQTFAGMLSWEKDLVRDLGKLVMTPAREDAYRARVAETKSTLFTDDVLSNKDVRVARNTDGSVFLVYGFLDIETVVITTSEQAFVEVIDRVRTARIIK